VRDRSVVKLPDLAKAYKQAGISWVAIGDENYGEGSSREHAAMEPRFMGGRAVIVRSFARIHEANLKKQGVLALTFANPLDYERVLVDDKVDIIDLAALAPGRPVKVMLHHVDGRSDEIETTHTMSEEHIAWFKAGSALNLLGAQQQR
jgi:aconitate hydratase